MTLAENLDRLLGPQRWEWLETPDGDPELEELYLRHYSTRSREARKKRLYLGPGEKLLLRTRNADAMLGWRKFLSDAGEAGVNCAIFRNETEILSSFLVWLAVLFAYRRWGLVRLYTYVDSVEVRRKRDPGRCFRKAGWRDCGTTKGGLLVMELPAPAS